MRASKKPQRKRSKDKPAVSAKSQWILVPFLIVLLFAAWYYGLDSEAYIVIAVSAGFIGFMAYVNQKPGERTKKAFLLVACAAAITNLGEKVSEKYNEDKSKPTFAIETKVEDQQAHINLNVLTGRLTRFVINYPVSGRITRIANLNPITDAKTTFKEEINRPEGSYLDNAEIEIEYMALNANLQYIISYDPVTNTNLVLPGTYLVLPEDGRTVYTIAYEWEHKGTGHSKTEFRSIQNDKIVDRPDVEIINAY